MSVGGRLASAATFLAFAGTALLPVAIVFALSLRPEGASTLDAYASVLADARQWGLLRNTLTIAGGTALLATILGAPMAWAIEYLRVPTRGALAWAVAIPLLIPPYVSAIVWADALGRRGLLRFGLDAAGGSFSPYTVTGVILVLALSYFPIVTLTTAAAFRRYDARVEEPARLVRGKARVFGAITMPLLAPAVLTGAMLVFILALVEFAVPSLLQVSVYTIEIYSRFSVAYDAAGAAAQSLPLLLCGTGVLVCWLLYVKPRQGRLPGRATARSARRATGSIIAALACWLLVAVSSALPLALLIRRSLPLSTYVEVWKTAREEAAASLMLAAVSATVLVILAFAMAYFARAKRPAARLYPLSFLPFLISGPLLGIGLILVWNRPGACAIVYDSPVVLVLACVARFLFFAYAALHAAMRDLPPRLEEAAAVAGVPRRQQAAGILLPLLSPALAGVWGLGFVFSLRELDAAVLVAPPGWNPLSVRLFSLMHYGPSRLVAALSVTTVVMVLAGGAVTAFMYTKARHATHAGR